jgi:hypothetical protein
MCVHNVFSSRLSSFMCHDTVSYYNITLISLYINWHATSDFCQCGMHETSYDTSIVISLMSMSIPKVQLLLTEKYKTTHNGSIIASIMHYMHAKSWCGTIINKERGECDIISWYCIIARQSRKINDKYILYTYL